MGCRRYGSASSSNRREKSKSRSALEPIVGEGGAGVDLNLISVGNNEFYGCFGR